MDKNKDSDGSLVPIKVELETRERLKARKRGGETYGDVITKLLGEGEE